ncbi:MAG: hypothetical protein IKZ10_04040 [Akkermansia sp.]|nr:hypothetical protein [Akkermansia sp.]
MKFSTLIASLLLIASPVASAICTKDEEARVYAMMQAAENPHELFFAELCARNIGIILSPLQWEEESEEFGRSSYDSTEEYMETRSVELYRILHSGDTVEKKIQAYRDVLRAHPEMAEEFVENLLMQYYLVGKKEHESVQPLPHTREEYRQMAEQLFRTPGLNWGARGKSGMTPAGVLFRFVMGTTEVEPLADLFCRYASFDETDCLFDHPPVALATMADCPQALRLLLARGNTTPEMAAYCIRMMGNTHSQDVMPDDVAEEYCGLFYLSNDSMFRDRLKLKYAQRIRDRQHGDELLDLLLPLLQPESVKTETPPPVTQEKPVHSMYPALQRRCPGLLPQVIQAAAPQQEDEKKPYDEYDSDDEEELTPITEIPDYSEEEVEQAVERMESLLRADSVVSINHPYDERHEKEDEEMAAAATILYWDTYRHKRIPECVARYALVRQLESPLEELIEIAEDADYTAEDVAHYLQVFIDDEVLGKLEDARYLKWEKLLLEQTRELDIAVPLQLCGNETEVVVTVSASDINKVQSVTYKREGQGGTPWNPIVRYRSYVLVGGASTVLLEPAYQQPVVYAEQEIHDFIERTPIFFLDEKDFTSQIGRTVRYVGYAPDYAMNGATSQWRIFEEDGSLSEDSVLSEQVEKVIPVMIRLTE